MKVLFFAQLRELLGCEALELETPVARVGELRRELQSKGGLWRDFLEKSKALVAVNQVLVDEDYSLSVNDEVAFFPPVTGG